MAELGAAYRQEEEVMAEKPKNQIVITRTAEPSRLDPARIIRERCRAGHHRWAYLSGGGQACYYCGVGRR